MSEESRGILACYALALPLMRGFPITTHPVLHLTGPSGGGKSQTGGRLASWMYGVAELGNMTVAGAYQLAETEPLLTFDDCERMDTQLTQFVLTASTGVTRTKFARSGVSLVRQRAMAPIILTSIAELSDDALRASGACDSG